MLNLGHGIQLTSETSPKPTEIEDETNFFPVHPVKSLFCYLIFLYEQETSPVNPDSSPRGLIRESLINKDTSKHGLVYNL